MLFKGCLGIFFLFSIVQGNPRQNIIIYCSRCKHYTTSINHYKDFFEITDKQLDGTAIDFHFSVKGQADAHVLFAPSKTVRNQDPAYEIVLGASRNKFLHIRRSQKNNYKNNISFDTAVLSPDEYRSFWIHIKDGFINLGKEGEEAGMLNWTDPNPLPLKVFSFGSYGNVKLDWMFDCPFMEFLTNPPTTTNSPTVSTSPTLPTNIIRNSPTVTTDIKTTPPTSTNLTDSPTFENYAPGLDYENEVTDSPTDDTNIITNLPEAYVTEYSKHEYQVNSANLCFNNRFSMAVYFLAFVILLVTL